MCPQLISCKQNGASYDATKADIWACGVLLFVMLLGMFPYDHTEHPDPNSSDAHMEVRSRLVKQAQMRGRTSEQCGRGVGVIRLGSACCWACCVRHVEKR